MEMYTVERGKGDFALELAISEWGKNKGQTPWSKQLRHRHPRSLLGQSCQRLQRP